MRHDLTRRAALALAAAALALPAAASDFDLDALIEAAKAEPPITVYDSTSKIKGMAEAFTAKYGVQATGQKVSADDQVELVLREAQAGAVRGDVVILGDAPAGVLELIPQGAMESWLPPDLADRIPAQFQNPLVPNNSPVVWAFNTGAAETCPFGNVWELTEPEFRGRVALQDPLKRGELVDFFNQMETHGDATMAAAFQARYGEAFDASQGSATAAWVARLAANAPLLTESDQAIADAVGAPGQTESFVGIVSTAKFRDNAAKGYQLGFCADAEPFAGFANPKLALIATGTKSPNAAKLFVRYVMTPEGIAPQTEDGKMPTHLDAALPADEPSGVGGAVDRVFFFNAATAADDFDRRQDWQDLWRLSYAR
ncbi:ABC transporter substrate-binding protein [Rubrimonas sp.]|uniref:ABC transporter substrate-binding protein n=1 Tax=Rubrimonas sp. TaxID=2036015 RepID=UPI002FDDF45C